MASRRPAGDPVLMTCSASARELGAVEVAFVDSVAGAATGENSLVSFKPEACEEAALAEDGRIGVSSIVSTAEACAEEI